MKNYDTRLRVNHCIHGVELNAYCPSCTLEVLEMERWLGTSIYPDLDYPIATILRWAVFEELAHA